MSTPLVSILIPCHNAERWLARAIRSALDQTYPHIEVVVVDDGSTDGSLEVIKGFEGRIRWETGPNRGANAARNRLLELSRGEWLQYLDADDWLLPTKIAVQIAAVAGDEAYGFVASPTPFDNGEVKGITPTEDGWIGLLTRTCGITTGMLWKRSPMVAAGGWDEAQPCGQEYAMLFRLLKLGVEVRFVDEKLCVIGTENRGSVSRKNLELTMRMRMENILEADRTLAERGELTPERHTSACLAVINAGHILWPVDRAAAADLVRRYARRIDPGFAKVLRGAWPLYGGVYSLFGYRVAQCYDALVGRLRKKGRGGPSDVPKMTDSKWHGETIGGCRKTD